MRAGKVANVEVVAAGLDGVVSTRLIERAHPQIADDFSVVCHERCRAAQVIAAGICRVDGEIKPVAGAADSINATALIERAAAVTTAIA